GNMDGFFVKYTNAGNQQWAKKCVFSQESDYASCITSDNVGNLYVTGHAGKINTQFGNSISVAQEGFFLTRYDANGNANWAYGYGGDIPSFAAWDQGFGVSTMNGITSVGGNFMSNALFFGDLEVAHTADFGNVQAFYAQYLTGEAPEILDLEETVDLCLNATLEEGFFLAPNVLPYTIQWYFNDAPFDGSDSTILTIPAVTIDDEGTYYCVVTNACGSAQSDVTTVFVNLPPEIPTLAEDEFCISDLAVMLPAGTWSGPGVNGSIFYPGLAGVGNHPLIVSLLSPEDCESIDTVIVSVYPQFYMGEDASDTVCVQLTNYDLSALLSEDANANGLWYLPGFIETDPQFSPAEFGVGEHEFWYFNPEFGPCDPDTAFFFVYVDACISVNESGLPPITFYPNPADETLVVKLNGMLDTPVEILDATGRIIISQMPVTQHSTINISTLVPGIYTLRHGSGQQKLIVE
ncbi:MAG: T9SS type A sorting domain-containing protein, partial [Flavobacteriales bacterium]|nr:T9SS type A sorting domain-containing protein [Flavobacteriales bacterium]